MELQSEIKRYSILHFGVLANKPELLMEIIKTCDLNLIHLQDFYGHSFMELVEIVLPDYLDMFNQCNIY